MYRDEECFEEFVDDEKKNESLSSLVTGFRRGGGMPATRGREERETFAFLYSV